MNARFRILLPFALSIPEGLILDDIEMDSPPYRVLIHRPVQSLISTTKKKGDFTVPFVEIGRELVPASPQQPGEYITLNDQRTLQADLLEIDFHRDHFDRSVGQKEESQEPTAELALEIANSLLRRLRSVGQAGRISTLQPESATWMVEYLTDKGESLPEETGLFRRRLHVQARAMAQGVTKAIWEKVKSLPRDYEAPTWNELLLDAEVLLPQVGPALVLAATAIETVASVVTDHLALSASLPNGLWDWVSDRGEWQKEPSVEERCDVLLKILSGTTLKQNADLWEAFKNIKTARNRFVHDGKASIGGKSVTIADAANLVGRAKQIVSFLEGLLPEPLRTPIVQQVNAWTFRFNNLPAPSFISLRSE